MPRAKPDTAYNIPRLNIIFSVLSCVFLFVVIWMILDDYSKEWKIHQRTFLKRDRVKTEKEWEAGQDAIDREQYEAKETELEAANQEFLASRSDYEQALEDLEAARGDRYAIDKDYQEIKQNYDSAKYFYEVDLSHQKDTPEQKAELDELETALNDKNLVLEAADTAVAEVEARVTQYEEARIRIEKEIGEITKEVALLEEKLDETAENFTFFVRNAPILDLMNPSIRVQQAILHDLEIDLNFIQVERVDRCMTCHLAIDKPGYEDFEQPYRTHPNLDLYLSDESTHPLQSFGCTSCHAGDGRGLTFTSSVHTPRDDEQKREWVEKHHWHKRHHWEEPMLPMQYIESSCFKCHQQTVDVPQAAKLNHGIWLMETRGCWSCHLFKTFETRSLKQVGPDLNKIASKTTPEFAHRWIADPKSIRPTTKMPQFFGLENTDPERDAVEIQGIVQYLFDVSEKPEYEAPLDSADVAAGEQLVQSRGCLACHITDLNAEEFEDPNGDAALLFKKARQFGPSLAKTGGKINAEWAFNWLKDPKQYNSETRMPNLRLSDEDAASITAYLMSLDDPSLQEPTPDIDPAILNEVCKEGLMATRTTKQAEEELQSMSTEQKLNYVGQRMIIRYGCYGCHNIKGFEDAKRIGTELSEWGSKPVARLDFGLLHDEIPETREAWLLAKLGNTRIFDRGKLKKAEEHLKMPQFNLTPYDREAIVTAAIGMTKDVVHAPMFDTLTPKEQDVENGRRLIRENNCQACHQLEEWGGAIQSTIELAADYPPWLEGEGRKVQMPWLFQFLYNPYVIRPWLEVRMPTFEFQPDQVNTFLAYFSHIADEPYPFPEPWPAETTPEMLEAGKFLYTAAKCSQCHRRPGEDLTDVDKASLAPDLFLARDRLKPTWILDWMRDPLSLQPGTKMPTFWDYIEYGDDPSFPTVFEGEVKPQLYSIVHYLWRLGTPEDDQIPLREEDFFESVGMRGAESFIESALTAATEE